MKSIGQTLTLWFSQGARNQPLPSLGARELDVIKCSWQYGEQSAQQMLIHFQQEDLSLSTLQSTLERLYRKGLLSRKKCGRQYFYTSVMSQSEMITRMLEDIASQISDGDMAPMLSGIMDFVGEENSELLASHAQKAKPE